MSSYSMEAEIEATRLEEQVFQKNYNISEELSHFKFNENEVILDAGCGSGVLARYLASEYKVKHVDGMDFSGLRLQQAKNFSAKKGLNHIHFYEQDLENIDAQFYGKYDTVICRYVLEHTAHPVRVIEQLKKTLKPQGRLIIFDLDGVFLNLYSQNQKFNAYMKEIVGAIHFDLEIGRKLPAYLRQAGFKNVNWNAEIIACTGERLKEEFVNTEKRFVALQSFFNNLFGSEARAKEFADLYLQEMIKPENTLVFNKYICVAN